VDLEVSMKLRIGQWQKQVGEFVLTLNSILRQAGLKEVRENV